jgi:tRNA pseudouridine38-40 synthase
MPRYAFLIEYDGGPFHGWQRQDNGPSVQAALERALAALDPAAPRVQGAGRTDAGVHATGQVAHADLSRVWDSFRLAEALNWHLKPAPVAVLACAAVTDDFHARFSATGRSYDYVILERRAPPASFAGRVWHVRHRLDGPAMADAATRLVGRHDFTTFRAALCQADSPVRTLDAATLREDPAPGGRLWRFTFCARSFLHAQVRSMVGSLERVGAGAWSPDDLAAALAAADRRACGPVAPPDGLTLTRVRYPADPFASKDPA